MVGVIIFEMINLSTQMLTMLDIILLILVAILVKYTFQSIGGFIRWIVFRKKSLKAYVKDDREGNLATFLLTVALVAIITIFATV